MAIAVFGEVRPISTNSRKKALIALGANLPSATGTPLETLTEALRLMDDSQGAERIAVTAVSRWRRSPAYPPGSGPDFVNGVAAAETDLSPEALLERLHEIEAQMGRTREKRWEPRICDLDLIAFGEVVAPGPARQRELMTLGAAAGNLPPPGELVLPHPRMHERAFVLAPMADIAPDWRHPVKGATVAEMLAALPADDRAAVEVIDV